jgi:hypothetical protein
MVTVKDLGDKVQVSILLPVLQKPLGEGISKNGFDYKDLKSYGFSIIMKTADYVDFIEQMMNSFQNFQFARAEVFKTQLDEASLH